MEKAQEPPKKCFCARCFLPIDPEDKVDIEGQSFHRICSMCCVCRAIPPSLKMFYGHVFCNDCFKTHVLSRFRGESPRIHSNSWWMQWAPCAKPSFEKEQEKNEKDVKVDKDVKDVKDENAEEKKPETESAKKEEPPRKCICARCLQAVDENDKVDIGGQHFHPQCARCYFCHSIPKDNLKIYYGQVFCEECFNKHVLNRSKDNPSEFFKNCFEQWQNNAQFAENMREFLAGNRDNAPFIFMMQGQQPPFCRCGTGPQEWFQSNEPKKSATPAVSIEEESFGTWDLSFENRTEMSDAPESCHEESANLEISNVSAAEKIEKLTKYLHEKDLNEKLLKKWQNFNELDKLSITSGFGFDAYCGWVNMQDPTVLTTQQDCPKCLWQCGPIYVNREYLKKVSCGDVNKMWCIS